MKRLTVKTIEIAWDALYWLCWPWFMLCFWVPFLWDCGICRMRGHDWDRFSREFLGGTPANDVCNRCGKVRGWHCWPRDTRTDND